MVLTTKEEDTTGEVSARAAIDELFVVALDEMLEIAPGFESEVLQSLETLKSSIDSTVTNLLSMKLEETRNKLKAQDNMHALRVESLRVAHEGGFTQQIKHSTSHL